MAQYGNHWGGPPSHPPGYGPPQNGAGGPPPSHSFTTPPQPVAPPPGVPLGAPPPQFQHQQQHTQFAPPPGVQQSIIGAPPGGAIGHIGGQFGGSIGGPPPGQQIPPPITAQQMQHSPWAPPTSVSQVAPTPQTSVPPPNMPFATGPPHLVAGPPMQQQQQDVWIEIKTANGQSYYYNSRTQQNSWTRPEGAKIEPLTLTSQQQTPTAAGNQPPPQQLQQINPNDDIWAVTRAADGRIYFYNAKTRETSWTQPVGPNVKILSQEEVEVHKQASAQRSNEIDKRAVPGGPKGPSRWSMPPPSLEHAQDKQTMQTQDNPTLQTQDNPTHEPKDESKCMVCKQPYSDDFFPKVSLPKCGHCMCRPCLTKLLNSESPKCPECRKPYTQYKFNIDLKDLPADFHLNTDLESSYICEKHSETSTHYCKDCKIQVCVECTLEGKHKKCDLVKNSIIRVQKTMMKEHGTQMIVNLDSSKEKQLKQIDNIIVSLLRNAFININLDEHLITAHTVVDELEELKDCSDILARKETMDTIQSWYCRAFPEDKDSLILASESKSNSESDILKNDTEIFNGDSISKEDSTSISKDDSTKKGILKDKNSKKEDIDNKINSKDNKNKRSSLEDPLTDEKESKRRKPDGITCSSVSSSNTNPNNYIFNSLVVKCGVFHSDGRWARITCEDKGVHLYTLRTDEEESRSECSIMLQYASLRDSIPENSTLTFLDIGIRGVKKGRLYVRMFGQTARGQQFTWFCSGEKGPSYRNLKFKSHHNKNKAGEWIATDDYSGEQSPPLVEGLTYGGEVSHPVEAGTVTGFFKSARFGIYLEANPKQSTALSFGKVETGLKSIKTALKNEKIEDVDVMDCGLVLPK